MFGRLLLALFVVVPLLEIALFTFLGQSIGALPTLLGVLVAAVAGALLIRWQGIKVLRDLRVTMARGELPARRVGDAMLIGLAGVLLVVPGYFSDLIGLLLLMPFIRTLIYRFLARRIKVVPPGAAAGADARLVDLDQSDWRQR